MGFPVNPYPKNSIFLCFDYFYVFKNIIRVVNFRISDFKNSVVLELKQKYSGWSTIFQTFFNDFWIFNSEDICLDVLIQQRCIACCVLDPPAPTKLQSDLFTWVQFFLLHSDMAWNDNSPSIMLKW